jgi:nucleoside-diphosphate-sugar epimerase
MKILITGGAGYIGAMLIPLLLRQGLKITVYDSLLYGGSSLLPYISNPDFAFIKGDIRDKSDLHLAIKAHDLVIHLAAIVGLSACNKDPQLAYSINVEGTKNVAENVSRSQGLIYASTVSNYGASTGNICTEGSPLNPLSHYSRTKTVAEQLILDNSHNPVCFRFATAFGVSSRMRLDLLINDFVYQACVNKFLILFEKAYKRTFVHVQDICRGILFAIQNYDQMQHQVFNVGDDANNCSKEDIALKIKERIDYYLHFADIEEDEDKRNYCVSYEKINSLGFRVSKTVDEGIDELIKACQIFEFKHPYKNL